MKKTLTVFLFVLLSMAVLTTSLFANGSSEAKPMAKDEKVTITFWDGNWNEEAFKKIQPLWDEKHPNIELKGEFYVDKGMFDKYILSMQTGTGPDVASCALDWVTTLGSAGLLEPLDSYLKADKIDVSQYVKGAIDASTINGNLYGLPFRSETYVLFYNKDIFEAAGYTEAPKTWDEVIEIAKATTKGDVSGYGLCGSNFGNFSFQYITMLRSHGGDVVTPDLKKSALNTPAAIKTAELYKELSKYAPASMLENDNVANRTLFANGKIAMYLSGIYDVPNIINANPDLNFACALVPVDEGAQRSTILGGWSVAIPKTSKHKAEAALFVEFLTSPEVAELYTNTFTGTYAPAAIFKDVPTDIVQPNADALAYAKALPATGAIVGIRQAIFDDLSLCLSSDMTAKAAILKCSDNVDKLLADQ
jgi:ABC-type glycerol-3-phosphate transport system substrate-binding protein